MFSVQTEKAPLFKVWHPEDANDATEEINGNPGYSKRSCVA